MLLKVLELKEIVENFIRERSIFKNSSITAFWGHNFLYCGSSSGSKFWNEEGFIECEDGEVWYIFSHNFVELKKFNCVGVCGLIYTLKNLGLIKIRKKRKEKII